jgi:hypothetical protein
MRHAFHAATITPLGVSGRTLGNGESFDGDFVNGHPTLGTYRWPDGATWDGTLAAGKLDGQAKYTYPNGTVVRGTWEAGKPRGQREVQRSGRLEHAHTDEHGLIREGAARGEDRSFYVERDRSGKEIGRWEGPGLTIEGRIRK